MTAAPGLCWESLRHVLVVVVEPAHGGGNPSCAHASVGVRALERPPENSMAEPAAAAAPRRRLVFFVRHAESCWNDGVRRRDLRELLRHVDHPITERGCEQAFALQRALQQALHEAAAAAQPGKPSQSSEAAADQTSGASAHAGAAVASGLMPMAAAREVWSSPFTRAVQTALIALLPILERGDGASSIRLKPHARETKGLGWDNIGGASGEHIPRRALALLRRRVTTPFSAQVRASLGGVRCDARESCGRWWDRLPIERMARVLRRLDDLLRDLRESTSDDPIVVVRRLARIDPSTIPRGSCRVARVATSCHQPPWPATHLEAPPLTSRGPPDRTVPPPQVSHSRFLRLMFAHCLVDTDGASVDVLALARRLRSEKLPNCAVVCCELLATDSTTSGAASDAAGPDGGSGEGRGRAVLRLHEPSAYCWPAEWPPKAVAALGTRRVHPAPEPVPIAMQLEPSTCK